MVDKSLSFREIQTYQADRIAYMQQMVAAYGNLVHLRMSWIQILLVNEPELVRELLVKNASLVHRDPYTTKVFKRILGNGVLVAEGRAWQRQRRLVQPAFHALRIRDYTDVMATYTREWLATWRAGEERLLDQELTQLTLRIIAKTMYNVDIGAQTEAIGRHMAIVTSIAEEQLARPFIPPAWVPTPSNRRQNRAINSSRDLLRAVVRERVASGQDEGDLLSMLVQARDEDGSALSEKELVDECMTLFVAGHETTAALMTWVWYLLGQHPDLLARLKREVDEVLGKRPITFADLDWLPYSEWVIKETLRMYPPAWSVARVALEDFALGPRQVKKGMLLFVSPYLLQRAPENFPDPERFRPERWADGERQPHRYAYIPFGAGPRVCLGNLFAMLEARVILVTMVQQVALTLLSRDVTMDLQITLRPKEPLRIRVATHPIAAEAGNHL